MEAPYRGAVFIDGGAPKANTRWQRDVPKWDGF